MIVEIFCSIFIFLVIFGVRFSQKKFPPDRKHAVLITGCDSGIGYSIAKRCHEIGFTVFAACLNADCDVSGELRKLQNVFVVQLDVTSRDSLRNASSTVNDVLKDNPEIVFKTLVNNAGVMVFGEFSWQTDNQIQNQIGVNLVGVMNVTRTFLPHIRRNKGRIINICSHCSLEALPGLSVYAGSKAGLLAWTNALRVELKKFGVPVISLIPGSYPQDTKIFAQHQNHVKEMQENMSSEDWRLFEKYFKEYNYYLSFISSPTECRPINDDNFYNMFNDALLSVHPYAHYCYSPWRYFFYHSLFKITPTFIRDWLVLRFVNMPAWRSE